MKLILIGLFALGTFSAFANTSLSLSNVETIEEWAFEQLASDVDSINRSNIRSCIKGCRSLYPTPIDFPSFTSKDSRKEQTKTQKENRAQCLQGCKDI